MVAMHYEKEKRSFGLCFAFCMVLSLHACAQTSTESPAFQPGDVNTEFSRVFIFVDKSGVVGHPHAIEGKLSSGRWFQRSDAKGTLIFDMTSFDADGPQARKYLGLEGETDAATRTKVNENMRGEEVLWVKKFPEAKLESVSLRSTGRTSKRKLPEFVMAGEFTLHESTRPIEFVCDMELKDGWQHIRGAFKILQSDYGIKPYSKMMGAVGVKDELIILGDLWVAPSP